MKNTKIKIGLLTGALVAALSVFIFQNVFAATTIGDSMSTSGNFSQSRSATFSTGTGAVSLNGDITVADGKTLTVNGGVVLGDNGDTVQINSSDWDISTTGIIEGVGNINTDGNINTSAATISIANGTSTTVNIGAAATILNISSITIGSSTKLITLNGSTTIAGLFTANGEVVLGDNGDTVQINSSDWDISTTGVMEGIGNINTDGNINTSAATVSIANGTSTTVNIGAAATTLNISGITIGSSTKLITLNGSTTVTGAVVLSGLGSGTGSTYLCLDGSNNLKPCASGADSLQASYDGGNTITTSGGNAITFTLTNGGFTITGAGAIALGDSNGTVAINSSDWDISTTGVIEGIGNINTDGNINTTASTVNIANGTSTTVNIGAAATTLNISGITIGSSTKLIHLNGSTTIAGALDANGDVSIADTDIAFDGASATFTTTGAFTLTPGGAVILGDGDDTMRVNSSDWDISTTGIMEGVGDINTDGNINTSATDVQIANGTSTTVRIGGAATTLILSGITIDSSTQSITLNGTTTLGGPTTLSGGAAGAHMKFTQTTAPSIGTPSACGSGPSASIGTSGTDGIGTITLTTGSGSPTTCDTIITFNQTYASTPKYVMISPAATSTTAASMYVSALSNSSFTIGKYAQALTASTTYTLYYMVIE